MTRVELKNLWKKPLIKPECKIFSSILATVVCVLIFMFSTSASAENADYNNKMCCPEEEYNQIFVFTEPTLKSEEIKEIQAALKRLGYYSAEINGEYDRVTEAAVKKFQRSCRMRTDGIFGTNTRRALSRVFETETEQVTAQPPKGTVLLVINTDKKKLYVYNDDKKFMEFAVAVGTKRTPTPIGEWKIIKKSKNWGTGFGTRWMGLSVPWGIYGIHGTNKPWSIGADASHGCIRMFNSDVEKLYNWVKVGTTVKIEGQIFEPLYEDRWTIVKGQRGSDVVLVQKGLAAEGYLTTKPDGIFGNATEHALKKLQKDRGLEVSGQVDTDTWGILGL